MTESEHRYVALLRGINVGGHSLIKMADLRELFKSYGLTNVTTYIQSGNVLFSTPKSDARLLAQDIEAKWTASMDRKMAVFLRTRADLQRAAKNNPFEPERLAADQRCHLYILSAEPEAARRSALMKLQGEDYRFHVQGKVLYYAYPEKYVGNRRTIDFEKVLGVTGTSRT